MDQMLTILKKSWDLGQRASHKAVRLTRRAGQKGYFIYKKQRAQSRIQPFSPPYKLHLGCGPVKLDSWINIDIDPNWEPVDLVWDLTQPFPFRDNSCRLAYNEHFIEHITVKQGVAFLRECYRVLQPGGVLRIATPDLAYVVQKYSSTDWRDQAWLRLEGYRGVQTRAEMLNGALRWWNHQWLYDSEELHRRLREAGFQNIRDVPWGESEVPELCGLETREDSKLICEAVK